MVRSFTLDQWPCQVLMSCPRTLVLHFPPTESIKKLTIYFDLEAFYWQTSEFLRAKLNVIFSFKNLLASLPHFDPEKDESSEF